MMFGFRKIKRNLPIDRYYFLRKVDELGRVIIPIEIRNELNVKENDEVKLLINDYSFTDKLDGVGGIRIPKEIREKLDIKVADTLKLYIENKDIRIENKYII